MSPTTNLPECGIRPPELFYYFCLRRGNLREAALMRNRDFPLVRPWRVGLLSTANILSCRLLFLYFSFFFLLHEGKFLTIKSRNSNTCGYQSKRFCGASLGTSVLLSRFPLPVWSEWSKSLLFSLLSASAVEIRRPKNYLIAKTAATFIDRQLGTPIVKLELQISIFNFVFSSALVYAPGISEAIFIVY